MTLVAALAAGLAALLVVPGRRRLGARHPPASASVPVVGVDESRPWRRLGLAVLAGGGGAVFVGGPFALVVGATTGGLAWWWLGTVEPPAVRAARESAARDLPTLVALLAAALRSGAAPPEAVRLACVALPGPAADRLAGVAHRLALGADPVAVWSTLAGDDALAPLGRAMARAHESGAPVVDTVERLADELDEDHRARAEARARSVGVKAALPLGLCLLPSFLLLGIVPLAAGLLGTITG